MYVYCVYINIYIINVINCIYKTYIWIYLWLILSFICSGIQLLESLYVPLEDMKASFIAQSGLPTSLVALLQPQVSNWIFTKSLACSE